MGQFQSKEYDGDPYIDLMRALPERELIWWVQKAIWVSLDRTAQLAAAASSRSGHTPRQQRNPAQQHCQR